MQFESDLEIFKNPPAGYQMPSADIIGGLDAMESKAASGVYRSQFDFDSELKILIASAYQGHFAVMPCSLSLFTFHNPASLVSISQNGTSLPELYMKGTYFGALNIMLRQRTRSNMRQTMQSD